MRIFKGLLLFVAPFFFLATINPVSVHADTTIPTVFNFQGSGYGHGIGMSQIGARAQALEGRTASQILRYYYSYVTVEPFIDDQMLRVNIGHLLTNFSLRTDSALGQVQIITGNADDSLALEPLRVMPTKAQVNFTLLGDVAFPTILAPDGTVDSLPSGTSWTIRWTGTRYLDGSPTIVSFVNGKVTTKYRYGQIQVKLVKTAVLGYRIEVTNTVRLHDEYLWGIGEVPSSWPLAALQAQAIASRTYALNKSGSIKTSCDCNLYGSSQDQAFVGYSKESEATYGKLWKAAVTSTSTDDTTGLTILFNSKPIGAYYSSSSGGITESSLNAWGTALTYAISVPDPWSLDPTYNSRYAKWVRPVTQALASSAFGLPDVVSLQVIARNSSGTVAKIMGTSSGGKKVTITGVVFQSRTKLPSTWFEIVS
ncbi:MAG: SpoIID/LytB domain-containing protein [Candidatus Nanopelagicaceae bacterium]|nr:SpoIID/LytB domain-containing protein [Candidatus Nanopelagicaceae bacterium]